MMVPRADFRVVIRALSPVRAPSHHLNQCCIVVHWTIGTYITCNEIRMWYKKFRSRKLVWKCRLQNGGHFDDINVSRVDDIVFFQICSFLRWLKDGEEIREAVRGPFGPLVTGVRTNGRGHGRQQLLSINTWQYNQQNDSHVLRPRCGSTLKNANCRDSSVLNPAVPLQWRHMGIMAQITGNSTVCSKLYG